MRVDRTKDGKIRIELDSKEECYSEEVRDNGDGSYMTWLFMPEDVAEQMIEQVKYELMETLMLRLRLGQS